MRRCESLAYVDPSIFSLPKLEVLAVTGCISLKSLSSHTYSKSLLLLLLTGSGLKELAPSILQIRNLGIFSSSINCGLMDLPNNFANLIMLSESRNHETDTLFTLHKVLASSGFQSVTNLHFSKCPSLCENPENISLLSALQFLRIDGCAIISLPVSMKYLSRLKLLDVGRCKMLQCVPALPQSIQHFLVWDCQSLQTMLSSAIELEPSKTPQCTFLLLNCIKVEEHSYDAILKDATVRIELLAKQPPEIVYTSYFYPSPFCYIATKNSNISYYLPARNGKVQDWFHSHFTQALFTIVLPNNLLGFIFYVVDSQVQSCDIGRYGIIGCKCYLQTGRDEWIYTSLFGDEDAVLLHPRVPFEFVEEHIFIWHDVQCCRQIMEVIEQKKATNDKSTS